MKLEYDSRSVGWWAMAGPLIGGATIVTAIVFRILDIDLGILVGVGFSLAALASAVNLWFLSRLTRDGRRMSDLADQDPPEA